MAPPITGSLSTPPPLFQHLQPLDNSQCIKLLLYGKFFCSRIHLEYQQVWLFRERQLQENTMLNHLIKYLEQDFSNCGMPTTTGTPTIVDWHRALIKI